MGLIICGLAEVKTREYFIVKTMGGLLSKVENRSCIFSSGFKCTHWTLALCPHLLLLLDTIKHNYREKQVVCGAKNCGVLNLRAFKPQTPSGKTDCPLVKGWGVGKA